MKKFILSLGLVAMMLNLTNCAQYDEVAPEFKPQGDFELFGTITRTANDGLNTVWSTDDELNVFHAEAGTTTYLNDTPYSNSTGHPFVCEAGSTGRFLGTLYGGALDATKSYDWYALYPYSSYIKSPANTSTGYSYIGGRSDAVQTQTGNNSMAHIAGANYPLVGYAANVAATTSPALVFTHASSLIEFEVVNQLNEALTVTSIEFTAPEAIVGTFFINHADIENITYTNASYVASTATLEVSNGTAIEAGASAKFYMAVKPFTAASGKSLTVKVSASAASGLGEHAKELTLTSDVVFAPGKVKNVKVNYNTPFVVAEMETWQLITSLDQITDGTYVIMAKQKGGSVIAYCPSTTTSSGPLQKVTTLFDLTTAEFETNAVPEDARWSFAGVAAKVVIKNAEGNYLYNTNTNNGVRVGSTSDSWTITTCKNNAFNLKDANYSRYLTLYATSNWRCYASAYALGNTDQNGECYLYKLCDETVVPSTPVLILTSDAEIEVEAEATTSTITYDLYNAVDGVSATATTTADWITITSAEGAFNLAIAANEGDAREATVTVAYEGAGSESVVVKQAAAEIGGGEATEKSVTFTFASYPKEGTTATEGDVTFTGSKGTASTTTRFWTDGLRTYAGGAMKFEVPAGMVITKIDFTGGSVSDWTGSQQVVEFTSLPKTTITSATVTYN